MIRFTLLLFVARLGGACDLKGRFTRCTVDLLTPNLIAAFGCSCRLQRASRMRNCGGTARQDDDSHLPMNQLRLPAPAGARCDLRPSEIRSLPRNRLRSGPCGMRPPAPFRPVADALWEELIRRHYRLLRAQRAARLPRRREAR